LAALKANAYERTLNDQCCRSAPVRWHWRSCSAPGAMGRRFIRAPPDFCGAWPITTRSP
jgi:hypothetical protein